MNAVAGLSIALWLAASQLDRKIHLGADVQSVDVPAGERLVLKAEGRGVQIYRCYIQRLDTDGGSAPTDTCDAGRTGAEINVPYTAEYLFYTPQ